jgi:hypothetical protein
MVIALVLIRAYFCGNDGDDDLEDVMQVLATTALFMALAALVGCSGITVSQDYDPHADLSRYGSWQWRQPVQPETGDVRADNPLQDKRIRKAVQAHLLKRQFAQTTGRPDFYLTYHLAIEPRIRTDTIHTTVWAGRYHYPWYGGIGTETRIRQYDQSRLTIDIHSAESGDLMWRGVGVYLLRTYKTPQEAAAAAQQTVDKILSQFPPGGTH